MRIVCDTGPILHLFEAGLLNLLHQAGNISIPSTVHAELIELIQPSWEKQKPQWIHIDPLSAHESAEAKSFSLAGLLDYAEAETVILARRLRADWLLTDDTAARILASSLGIEVHGSLGVVLWSAAVGHVDFDEAQNAIEQLSKTSLWISKNILIEARIALTKMFDK